MRRNGGSDFPAHVNTRADSHDGPEQMLQSKAGYIDARPLTASSAKPLATHGRTIHSGQTETSGPVYAWSVPPLTADMLGSCRLVRFVPQVELNPSLDHALER
jgi:hypothetical protein